MSVPMIIGLCGIALFFILIFSGVHIAVSLGIVGFAGCACLMGFTKAISLTGNLAYTTIASFDFAVIPLFVLMGMLVTYLGISTELYDTLAKWLGRLPGGLGIATVWSCAAFGTLNGSATVTASVFARACGPELTRHGYDKNLTYGMISAAGNIGQFIPPSVLIVVYGALSGDSIGRLLMAGISPGIGLALVFSLVLVAYALIRPKLIPTVKVQTTWKDKLISLKYLIPIVIVAVIIIGGIFGGIFSSAEAGAVGCIVFFIYAFIRKVPFKNLVKAFGETIRVAGMTYIILVSASFFAKFMTMSGLATGVINLVNKMHLSSVGFLFVVVIVYLIFGCFIDAMSSMSITLPLFYPVMTALNIDPIHFAMVVILALHCGGITPPVGMCVFTVKAFTPKDVKLMGIFKGAMPFLIAMIVLIVLFIFFPSLSTFLPNIMYG